MSDSRKLANWELADLAKAYRLKLLAAGYVPLPVTGKIPALAGWQNGVPDTDEIHQWTKGCPAAFNTGITTALTPTLDIDILNEEAAVAVEDLARERFEERGYILTRIGKPTKRAVLFRTDQPFDKIAVKLVAGNGDTHKIEFLGDGQQVVVFGAHPDTKLPYTWHGGEPGQIAQEDLPYITSSDAQQFVDDAAAILVRDFGYKLPNKGNGATTGTNVPVASHGDPRRYSTVSPTAGPRERQYAKAALSGCADEVASTLQGSRNDTLNAKAFRIGTMIGSGWISRDTAYDDLFHAALASGLDEREAHSTLESGLNAGEKVPHADLPDDTPKHDGNGTDATHDHHDGYEHHDQHHDQHGTERANPALNARALSAMRFPPIKYVVPDIIVEGLTLLAGKPKLGKSWLLLHAAIAVARGGFTLGEIHCSEGDVLCCALEDNLRRLQSRMTKLLGLQEWPERLHFLCEMPRLSQGGIEMIEQWIASVKRPRLIIIDTLAMVRAPKIREQSPYDADYGAVLELRKLASEHGLAVVVVHHLRKAEADDAFDTVSGTLGLTGAPDTVLVLKHDRNGTVILHGKGRDLVEIEKAMTFNKEACTWTITGEANVVHQSEERRTILAVLTEMDGPASVKDIVINTGLRPANVRRMLERMTSQGAVQRADRGRYQMAPAPVSATDRYGT